MKRFLYLFILMLSAIGCSTSLQEYSPEQVIQNALSEKHKTLEYYAESTWIMKENGEVAETVMMREWQNEDGQKRMETKSSNEKEYSIAINDGKTLLTYVPHEKKAYVIEGEELTSLNQQSPKEQAEKLLKLIQDTHEIKVIGEEKVAGRDAFHLKATAKKENSLIGNQDIWIDKETWFVLKMISVSGETTIEFEYTKIDYKVQNDNKLFTFELPEDAVVEKLQDSFSEKEITLEQAKVELGTAFLYIPETKDLKIAHVGLSELDGEINQKEIMIEYTKEGLPYLSLTVIKQSSDRADETMLPNEEEIQIRGLKGTWSEELRWLHWVENGMAHSINVTDPNVSLDELMPLLEKMVSFD